MQPVLLELDREMEEAAASLGAVRRDDASAGSSCPTSCRRSSSGAALAFARAVGEFGSVVLISGNIPFDTQVASVFVFRQIESDNADRRGRRLGRAAAALAGRAARDPRARALAGRAMSAEPAARRIGLRVVALGYLARAAARARRRSSSTARSSTASAPVWDSITTPAAIHAFWLTIEIAAIAVPLNTIFGIITALALVRGRFRGKALLDALIDLPFAISPVVVGLALILVYGRPAGSGWLADLPASRSSSPCPGMVLATIFVSLPFVVREVAPVLREIGDEQEQAAATLGASRWQTFWRVTLPAIRWGVAYGVVLSTARAIGEFGAVSVVSRQDRRRRPRRSRCSSRSASRTSTSPAPTPPRRCWPLIALATLLAMTLRQRHGRTHA